MMLEHANLTVASIDEAIRFLSAGFPHFKVRGRGAIHGDPARGEWLHFGDADTYLALQQNSAHSPAADTTYTNDGINHLGFRVEGIDALVERMEEAGYEPTPASDLDGHPHRRRVYFFDANRVEWEFVEYLSEDPAERNAYE